MSLTLVIGGTRSGKSRRAEELALAGGRPVRYLATADGSDPAMRPRIEAHAQRRPPEWTTIEVDERLAEAVGADPGACVLLDGLGTWIATLMHRAGAFEPGAGESALAAPRERVIAEIGLVVQAAQEVELIVVAEEAGAGVLPAEPSSRAWLDLLGDAVQALADRAERVEIVVAGRALRLPAPEPRAPGGEPGLRVHGDAEARPGEADHAVNVVDGGAPEWLREELRAALESAAGSYPREADACAALAGLHGRDPAEILPTNGASEALWLLPAALRPANAVCVHPAFTEGEAALRAHRIPVTRVLRDPDRDFALDPAAVPDDADLVIVGNPASPSGTLDPAAAIFALRRPGRVVAVDEAFMDMVPGEPSSLAGERLPDVIVIRSLTKSLGIPGLRAGYAIAPEPLAARLRAARPPGPRTRWRSRPWPPPGRGPMPSRRPRNERRRSAPTWTLGSRECAGSGHGPAPPTSA